ncbi:hypothetical protein F5Y14DRAFT_320234 [Nemania sp. NC0429]|nr:hypothetical protein F5Y14DRAFT_320234 [Nemania sp. NC0429]
MDISSWLESVQPGTRTDTKPRQQESATNTRQRKSQPQTPTPTPSTAAGPNIRSPPPNKRRRAQHDDDNDGNDDNEPADPDTDRTPRGRATLSNSDRTSSRSSGASRISASRRLARLELAPVNPVLITQIKWRDSRMPQELKDVLDSLEDLQSCVVPDYLAKDIEARAKEDPEFHNFRPSKFYQANETTTGAPTFHPDLSLDEVLEVFLAAEECFDENHAEAGWNSLVHWPVFQLALGPIKPPPGAAADIIQGQRHPARVRAMPCATARLQSRPYGAKMVDFCIFVEPQGADAEQVDQIREERDFINHTDYLPLRRRPIALSAKSTNPGEGYTDAQIQLSAWQAAQWALFESLLGSRATQNTLIPFLPALIIRGHEWFFAATTKSGRHTVLWVQKAIGATDSVLGVFQIIHALRYIAAWIREIYWPWYRRAILQVPGNEDMGG